MTPLEDLLTMAAKETCMTQISRELHLDNCPKVTTLDDHLEVMDYGFEGDSQVYLRESQ